MLSLAAPAGAGSLMKVGVDDDNLMQRQPGRAAPTAASWRKAGVDQSRITLIWSRIAPLASSVTRPVGFDPRNPNSPGYYWVDVDNAVAALRANQIDVTLALTTPGPIWASQVPSRRDQTYKPSPTEFGDFAHAVALRYGSQIYSYVLINEPNLWQWLTPQWSCKSAAASSCTPASPAIYRNLFRKGYDAIKAITPKAIVWGGSLAPGGSPGRLQTRSSLGPLLFLRSMGCVSSSFKNDRSSATCKGFKPLAIDGIAIHPHSGQRAPDLPARLPDTVTIATMSRLTTTIDKIQARGGVLNGTATGSAQKSKRIDVYISEYGVQTNPPDTLSGVSLSNQDAYYQQAAYMMWKNSRVKLFAQYLWLDEPVDAASFGAGSWQSGVYFASGKPKPSAGSFPHPFWVDLPRHSSSATLWGQVRPGAPASVTVQRKLGSVAFRRLKTLQPNAAGYFSFKTTVRRKSTFRFQYNDGKLRSSETRTVAPRR